MKIIVCCDDNNGILFNNRRVSQDIKVTNRIIELTKGSTLWMDNYSYSLFSKMETVNINVSENIMSEANDGEYCFVEKENIHLFEQNVEEIILFRWGRVYPSDKVLDINLQEWHLKQVEEFSGNSHDKITMEVYER